MPFYIQQLCLMMWRELWNDEDHYLLQAEQVLDLEKQHLKSQAAPPSTLLEHFMLSLLQCASCLVVAAHNDPLMPCPQSESTQPSMQWGLSGSIAMLQIDIDRAKRPR